ncbi:unnamed protein product [Caenorhabditis auriculariae]|uniref:Amine oxidase domain-containing protein n=1 Tax=Caenorhabditis auriculariae TaxID=2777116 RepID=A0A8S1GYX4_9PELO|nr:unnamed protein product [Caenorhabditis auriculariae]
MKLPTELRTGVRFMAVLNKNHREILRRSGMKWTPLHERLLQFHMGNLEFACGSSLADVSWRCWDQNEDMPSFAGRHALLVDGTAPIITKLTEQLDINFDIKVKNIEYERKDENDGYPIRIATEDALGNRKSFECDMVLCTMPLKVLQTSPDLFSPPLSGEKVAALKGIGAGLIEKVIVRFSEPFWEEYFEPGNFFFGHVPKVPEQRTVFNLFHDFSKRDGPVENRSYVLMSYLGGRSVDLVNEKSDEQIVELFVDVLKSLFPKKSDKIKAIDSFVTHWGKNAFTGMSYSYVKINGTGDDYDTIAKSVDDKVFFAGEHTCRFYPQTMTGSAMSGYREAGKILQILHKEKQ